MGILISCWYRHFGKQFVSEFLKKLNINLPYALVISLLGIHPRKMKTYVDIKTYRQMHLAVLFIIAPKWKQPKCPSAGTIGGRQSVGHSATKRNELQMRALTWMSPHNVICSKRSQVLENTHCLISFI